MIKDNPFLCFNSFSSFLPIEMIPINLPLSEQGCVLRYLVQSHKYSKKKKLQKIVYGK